MNFTSAFRACMAVAAVFIATHAVAQGQPGAWPSRPIKLVVPFSPGGTADNFARIVGQALSERVGQPVIVDNKPGGGGVIEIGRAHV